MDTDHSERMVIQMRFSAVFVQDSSNMLHVPHHYCHSQGNYWGFSFTAMFATVLVQDTSNQIPAPQHGVNCIFTTWDPRLISSANTCFRILLSSVCSLQGSFLKYNSES